MTVDELNITPRGRHICSDENSILDLVNSNAELTHGCEDDAHDDEATRSTVLILNNSRIQEILGFWVKILRNIYFFVFQL